MIKPTAKYWMMEYFFLKTVTDRSTTNTIDSIFIIWYVLADIRANPVKLRNEPKVSSRAGAEKTSGLILFF